MDGMLSDSDRLKTDIEAYSRRAGTLYVQGEPPRALRLYDRGNCAEGHMQKLHTDRNYNTLRYLERAVSATFYRVKDIETIELWREDDNIEGGEDREFPVFPEPEQDVVGRIREKLEDLCLDGSIDRYELWTEDGAIRLEYAVRADRVKLGFFGAENEIYRVFDILKPFVQELGWSYFIDEWVSWDVNDTDIDERFFREAVIAENAHFNTPEEWDLCVRYVAEHYRLEAY